MDLSTVLNKCRIIDSIVQEALLRVIKRRTLPKGTMLLGEGQINEEVYFIEDGLIRGFYYQGRKEITSWMANEGQFIWPSPSYLLREPSRENIQLLEPTTILSIQRQDMERLKRDHTVFDSL